MRIQVRFDGDQYFHSQVGWNNLIIYRGYGRLRLTTNSGKVGSTITLSALLDSDAAYRSGVHAPIAGRRVEFYVDGRFMTSPKTDSQGNAAINYRIAAPGTHVLKVIFPDNDTYYKGKTMVANFSGKN